MTDQEMLVASLLTLRQKLHSFHWEVTGVSFMELHKLFEAQYTDILDFADRISEYMRTMNTHPPSTLKDILRLSIIKESEASNINTAEMLTQLKRDFSLLAGMANESVNESRAWSNIMDDLHEYLMKQSWFIRSYLE